MLLSTLAAVALTLGMLVLPAGGEVTATAVPAPTVHYTFDGNLTDSSGASTATPAAACPDAPCNSSASFGSDAGGSFWAWASTNAESGGGFSLSTNAVVGDTYTLALKFSFSDVSGYRKIIDYENRTSDNGFYFLDEALLFYPYTSQASTSTYPADTVLDLIAVRQSTGGVTGTFTVYAVGSDGLLTLLFTADDTDGSSIPVGNGVGGTLLGFFFDDTAVDSEATPSGKVYDLRIWANQALTESELEEVLPPPAPTGVTAVAGDASATVSWTPSANATSYLVTGAPGGATCTAVAPATSCIVGGLTNGTPYTFTVVAISGGGTSSPSEPSNAVTPLGAIMPRFTG